MSAALDFSAERKARVAVLISGRGSNMVALADAAAAEDAPYEIVGVLSDQALAEGITRATERRISTAIVPRRAHPSRDAFENALADALEPMEPDLVCLAGFMRVLSPGFLALAPDRILNIHPSLLPSYPGRDAHRDASAAGARIHGATVHLVRPEVDAGPILAQAAIAAPAGASAAVLARLVLPLEHRLYPMALSAYATGALRLEGERIVDETGGALDQSALFAPPA